MRIAFYAPLKPPDHPVPSGDRRMAQLLGLALTRAGHDVEVATDLRSYAGSGGVEEQRRLAALGAKLAAHFIAYYRDQPSAQQPRAWLTYHLYYKAPDWIGPRVASELRIPYLVVEASVAMKRAGGPWSLGHEAVIAALKRADAVISLNPADDAGVVPHLRSADRLHHVKPFLEATPFAAAAEASAVHRLTVAQRFALDPEIPWLITTAMMRRGDKMASYRILGEALPSLLGQSWQLLVIGDGPASRDVETALAPLGERVRYARMLPPDAMPETLAACDLFVWPAINEAWGMAILEAQAAGLPVVAGRSGGVPVLVADNETGILTPLADASAFADAVATLLGDTARRHRYAAAARAKVAAEHGIDAAGATLDAILATAAKIRT
ncbi:MAG TPA: glycosyltransferase family 4 protein [Alphaproteobacteria bacterium]|nr:glycosyltransferase family 4 protein [Alphaproteobacteria bacterium]